MTTEKDLKEWKTLATQSSKNLSKRASVMLWRRVNEEVRGEIHWRRLNLCEENKTLFKKVWFDQRLVGEEAGGYLTLVENLKALLPPEQHAEIEIWIYREVVKQKMALFLKGAI